MRTQNMIDNPLSVPAFLGKLWKMVNDPKTDNLICWGKDGNTFVIQNEIDFLCIMLPMYYKHNKMSSFIRQLNMYGFRKIPIIDSKEQGKVEFEFMHPSFRRDHPELLIHVKRKGSPKYNASTEKDKSTENDNTEDPSDKSSSEKEKLENANLDDIEKVLSEVKVLHNQYAQVDGVINSLKQENAVLWREIAILRQKQQKQLQIVNKLIQFLMTVVQPSTRRGGGMGVKRRYPLMIHANPDKKPKLFSDGPTIHELDSSDVLADDLLQDTEGQDIGQVQSPDTSSRASQTPQQDFDIQTSEIFDPDLLLKNSKNLEITKSEHLVDELLGDSDLNDGLEDNFNFSNDDGNYDDSFLNSSSQDPLLANISDGRYNSNILNDVRSTSYDAKQEPGTSKMTVAKCYPYSTPQLNSVDDLRKHQDAMDTELDQLKDFLNNCNSIDSKYLLNLFNDTPSFGLSTNQNKDELGDVGDLLPASALTRYEPSTIDFNDLKDDVNEDEFVEPQYILPSPFNDNLQMNPIDLADINVHFSPEK